MGHLDWNIPRPKYNLLKYAGQIKNPESWSVLGAVPESQYKGEQMEKSETCRDAETLV